MGQTDRQTDGRQADALRLPVEADGVKILFSHSKVKVIGQNSMSQDKIMFYFSNECTLGGESRRSWLKEDLNSKLSN